MLLVAFNLRTAVTAGSPVLDSVRADLGLGAVGVGVIGLLPTVCFAFFGAITPWAGRRAGLERLLVAALVLTVLGQLGRALVGEAAGYLLGSAVTLAGIGMANVLLPPLVKRYLPDRVGAMTGAYSLALAIGASLAPALAYPVAEATGSPWRLPVALWAVPAAVALLPWLLILRGARVADHTATSVPVVRHWDRPVRTSPLAWGLAAMIGMASLNTYTMFAWLPRIYIDAGLPTAAAGSLLALYAGVGIPLSLVVPWAAVRLRNPLPMVLASVASCVVGYVGLMAAPASAPALWAVAAGLGSAAFPLSLALIGLRSRTAAGAATLSGFGQGVGYTLAGLGPLVVGILHETTGGWQLPIALLFGTLAVQVAGAVVICRPRFVEDDLHVAVDPTRVSGPRG